MVNRCCIVGCNSASHDRRGKNLQNGITFHRCPALRRKHGDQVSQITKSRRLAWIAAVRRENRTFHSILMSMRVCSLHFHSGKPANEMYTSHPDWAPSLHLGHTEIKATQTARYERQEKRKRQRTDSTPARMRQLLMTLFHPWRHQHQLRMELSRHRRRAEINRLLEENRTLKRELGQRKMDEDFLKEDTVKARHGNVVIDDSVQSNPLHFG
ncbi:uncharacterized protein LOC119793914 [Cyprinodon tularosa]|uniref:uncharacterized protein LOC119793914 n=1 Tax=Cyprinodon tularosa TaxID=77115 RepID=UPI0018E26D81|nr:uncharacterized protein LOC119793914 [Cyprinodon tularosa]